ncbi:MAG: hypothetical protein JXR60_01180 [Bacteroidales bacterium]|nr:hypothetical protein [Bacteroidales bacterium]
MEERNTQEIDLIELYQRIVLYFYKKRWHLMLYITLGLILGVLYYWKNSSIKDTHYLLEANNAPKELIYNVVEKFQYDIKTSQLEQIAENLKIELSDIINIKKISIDTTGMVFKLTIKSTSDSSVSYFANHMVDYINSLPYIKKQFKQKQLRTQALIDQIDKEIKKIDQFQSLYLSEKENSQITINQIDGSHSEKIKLFMQKQELQESIDHPQTISLINQKNKLVEKDKSLLLTLVISMLVSIVFALVVFFIQYSIGLIKKG